MLGLTLPAEDPLRILCLGAHSDDIEIGCGGTVLTLTARRSVDVRWVVFSAAGERRTEAETAAGEFLRDADASEATFHDFPDGRFPMAREGLKDEFERLESTFRPHLVFTHDEQDLHQDHALLGRLTRETFRDHMILGYEIPKFDGGLRSPNVFVALDRPTVDRKTSLILDCFASQRRKQWMDEETLQAMVRLRGVEVASDTRYAEGFHSRKLRIAL